MFILKKIVFFNPPPYNGVVTFNGGAKYEKATNFNFQQFHFIQNNKAFLNDTKHQSKLIYKNTKHQSKLIYKVKQELISKAIKTKRFI